MIYPLKFSPVGRCPASPAEEAVSRDTVKTIFPLLASCSPLRAREAKRGAGELHVFVKASF
jgi:hypothetical protein